MRRRLEFALIVVVLLCVPALMRIPQRLDPIAQSTQASGLSRNCDAPPQRTDLSSEALSAGSADVVAATEPPAPAERAIHDRASNNGALPPCPVASPPDSLRAPPVFHR